MKKTKPPAELQSLLTGAVESHKRGDLEAAERGYRAILASAPGHFDALHLLGAARAQAGNAAEAVELISRAIALNPAVAEAHYNLGHALHTLGRTAEALECYRKALALRPDYLDARRRLGEALLALDRGEEAVESFRKVAEAHGSAGAYCDLGNACKASGRVAEAVDAYRRALALDPGYARAYNGLGNALLSLGRAGEALAAYDSALAIRSDHPDATNNRGSALAALGRGEEALAAFRRALEVNPRLASAHYNLGNVLRSAGRDEEAIESYRRALAADPRNVEACNNLGTLLLGLNRAGEANEMLERALAIDPNRAEAHTNRGHALLALRRTEEAILAHRRAAALRPGLVEAHSNLGNVLRIAGRHEEARASYDTALALDPKLGYAAGMVASSTAYLCDWKRLPELTRRMVSGVRAGEPVANPFVFFSLWGDPADQLACAAAFVRDRHPAAADPLWRGERYRHDRIRVAYLSADFRDHAVAWLITELIERHDRSRFELFGISFSAEAPSRMRDRLKTGFEHFIDVRARSDAEVAAQLRELEIDIAVDLMGHTLGSRPGILARRPAPAQVNYLGFPATMGAGYIDYILADSFVIPEAAQVHYSEKAVYLPDSFQVNDSRRRIAERTPSRAEAGLPERGFVFCCFNKSSKLTPEFFDVWMRLLGRAEGSVLWLLAQDEVTAANLRREAQARGVAPGRLVFAPAIAHEDYLARLRLADLFLDTLPFNAGTTASDALWAGLPVLTCAGAAFASRMAGSLLKAIGLPELITHTLEDYEARALELATRPEQHRMVRERLAANRLTSPLFDSDRFRRHLESAYRTMWEITQRGVPPRSFSVEAEASGSSGSSATGTR